MAAEPLATTTAFDGRRIRIDVEEWDTLGAWEVARVRNAAAVLPITPTGEVVLVKQFRPAVRRVLTEIPAGVMDVEGEDALTCAGRELLEETGFRHSAIEFLGGYYASAGFTDEYVHVFWARTEAAPVAEPEEGIELLMVPLQDMVAAARGGKVRDVKTAYALLMAATAAPLP
jgi:ADP-ribose pyrophosphatase